MAPESEGGDGEREGGGGDKEREDELPTVVVMKKGDVGEEEYQKYRKMMKEIGKQVCIVQHLINVFLYWY